ncbi:MAG: hypothetical protein ACLP5H_14975 [Desulfomonilaceae bacterium]
MRTNDVESQLKKFETSQVELEDRYQRPLKCVEDRQCLVRAVSYILEKDGERELKLLILENRLPIILGDDRNWYEEWHPGGPYYTPVEELLAEALSNKEDVKRSMDEDLSPEDLLRLCVLRAVHGEINRLKRLTLQLSNEGEYSVVIERQIDSLEQLNTDYPLPPMNSRKS